MQGVRRKLRYLNLWKIYTMNAVQLFLLERALDFILWQQHVLVGGMCVWPEKHKFVIRLLKTKIYLWVSVQRDPVTHPYHRLGG